MGLESWMISIVIAVAGVISTFAVLRSSVGRLEIDFKSSQEELSDVIKFKVETQPMIEHLSKSEAQFYRRLNDQGDNLTLLKEKISQAPSMKEVRVEFVSKELFMQMEKHIDEKFDKLENGIDRILDKLDK